MTEFELRLFLNCLGVVGCLFPLWKGGVAERTAALVVMANLVIGQASAWFDPGSSNTIVRLCNDGLTALLLLIVTLRFSALWMGGVMLFYAAQFTLHSFYLVTERPYDYYYALINNIDFSSIQWCLVIGTIVAWRRRLHVAKLAAT